MILSLVIIFISIVLLWFIIKYQLQKRRRKNTIAFFHLYCSSGGGGERVLWHTIEALVKRYPKYTIYVYSHRDVQDDTLRILVKVRDLFKIDLLKDTSIIEKLEFVPLRSSPLIESKRYPVLTMLFQHLGSIVLACEAAYRLVPEVYIETIGFTFTLPIFKFHGCKLITYVHYPTISSDMISNVETTSHASYNNRKIFVRYPVLRQLKLFYYRILAQLYGYVGRQADLVMVNSTWTRSHITSLWKTDAHVVHPPCDIDSFKDIAPRRSPSDHSGALNVVSIAQFRPEKNHQTQIEAFDTFLKRTDEYESKLTMYGGCRDEEDKARVKYLRDLIHRLDLESNIEILVGASFDRLLEGLKKADVAIHTMENEHFGIVLLECMAAGLITVAHNSGGPQTDIIDDGRDGFLADDVYGFTDKLVHISKNLDYKSREDIRSQAAKKADQFSNQVFVEKLISLVEQFLVE